MPKFAKPVIDVYADCCKYWKRRRRDHLGFFYRIVHAEHCTEKGKAIAKFTDTVWRARQRLH